MSLPNTDLLLRLFPCFFGMFWLIPFLFSDQTRPRILVGQWFCLVVTIDWCLEHYYRGNRKFRFIMKLGILLITVVLFLLGCHFLVCASVQEILQISDYAFEYCMFCLMCLINKYAFPFLTFGIELLSPSCGANLWKPWFLFFQTLREAPLITVITF